MPGYLLDTNICILLLRGREPVRQRLQAAGPDNCFISEITVAELYFGAEKSPNSQQEFLRTTGFVASAQLAPIAPALRVYAQQRWRLQQLGQPLDDFDLLIGATAIANGLTMVTNNIRHFQRLPLPALEDWTQAPAIVESPQRGDIA